MTWAEACQDKSLENLPYKIELNRQGKLIMSPTRNRRGAFQAELAHLLRTRLPEGYVLVQCAIDTPEGTYVSDVTWAGKERFKIIEPELSCSVAPKICVEVWSQSNTAEEIEMKRRLYFEKGALEFWHCDQIGIMTFFSRTEPLPQSRLCPKFPHKIQA